MTESVVVEQDEDLYEKLGAGFFQVMVMELNRALKESGVDAAGVRQEVCSRFGYGMGNFIDQYWIEIDGKKHYPRICFATDCLYNSPREVEPVQFPPAEFDHHYVAEEVAVTFFEHQAEQLEGIHIGAVEDRNPHE